MTTSQPGGTPLSLSWGHRPRTTGGKRREGGPHLLPARLLRQRLQPAGRVQSQSAALAMACEALEVMNQH